MIQHPFSQNFIIQFYPFAGWIVKAARRQILVGSMVYLSFPNDAIPMSLCHVISFQPRHAAILHQAWWHFFSDGRHAHLPSLPLWRLSQSRLTLSQGLRQRSTYCLLTMRYFLRRKNRSYLRSLCFCFFCFVWFRIQLQCYLISNRIYFRRYLALTVINLIM